MKALLIEAAEFLENNPLFMCESVDIMYNRTTLIGPISKNKEFIEGLKKLKLFQNELELLIRIKITETIAIKFY